MISRSQSASMMEFSCSPISLWQRSATACATRFRRLWSNAIAAQPDFSNVRPVRERMPNSSSDSSRSLRLIQSSS